MIVLFLLMIVGYIAFKINIITPDVSKKLSAIVVNIANPAMILTSCMGEEKIVGSELVLVAGLVIAVYIGLMICAFIVPVILRVPKESQGSYQAMTLFSNLGFMGFPLVRALYGNSAVLYASLFMIPYNILIYTFGISAMSTGKDTQKEKFSWNKVFNVGTIACIITIVIYLLNIPVPEFISSTCTHLSNLTAPLSMMVIGASLATIDVRTLFTDARLLVFSVIKLIIIPIIGIALIRLFIDSELIVGVSLVMIGTPVGSMTAMLAQQYDGDYETTLKGVSLTTILSVVTLPLVSAIMGV